MKCDVCQTKIPLGQDTCPNCGYKMRVNHASAYDASGKTHNHIQVNKDYTRVRTRTRNKSHKFKQIFMVVIVVSLIVPVTSFIVFILGNISTEEPSYQIQEEIYQQYIDDETVEEALNFEQDFVQYLSDNDYSDIFVKEELKEVNDSYATTTTIDCEKFGFHYTVQTIHQQENIENIQLNISGNIDSEIDRDEFYIEENQINEIADYIQLDDVYSLFKDSRTKMKKQDGNYLYSESLDSLYIYMTEDDFDDSYYFYYGIIKNIMKI